MLNKYITDRQARLPLSLLLLLLCLSSQAQLLVNKGIYKSNFSNTFHQPRYVSYVLYKGEEVGRRE